MSQYTTPLSTRNRMSALEAMNAFGADLDFVDNPKKPGHLFFAIGTHQGFIGPKVLEAYKAGTLELEQMTYCESKKPELPDEDPITGKSNWVPCLMMSSKANVVKTFKRK